MLVQRLENTDPTKQVNKGRDVCCYVIPVGTIHGTREHPQTVAMYGDVMTNQHM